MTLVMGSTGGVGEVPDSVPSASSTNVIRLDPPLTQTQAWNPGTQVMDQTVHALLLSTTEPGCPTYELRTQHKEVFIGRHPGSFVVVNDRHVSSEHLRIYRDEAFRYFLEERGGSGCWINEQFMKKGETRALRSGDAITIGVYAKEQNGTKPFAAWVFRVKGHKSDASAQDSAEAGAMSAGPSTPDGSRSGQLVSGAEASPNLRSLQWINDNWDMSHVLGSGNFSEVRLGIEVKRGDRRAVKVIDKKKFKQFQSKRGSKLDLSSEAKLLMDLHHPNIVRFYDWFETENHLYLIMELMEGGDLLQCILENGCFTEAQARRLFQRLCEAVAYLHGRNIVHRDLKPENILLPNKDRDTMEPKLADFGLARMNMASRDCRTFCGTPHYFAPEVINSFREQELGMDGGYGKQADMWSLGVILYILLSGIPPFEEERLYEQITAGRYEFDSQEFTSVSPEAKELVSSLMQVNPKQRLDIEQALKHKWLQFSSPASPPLAGENIGGKACIEPLHEPMTKRRRTDDTMGTEMMSASLGA